VVEGDLCQPLVVPDAASHPYFASNPLVMSGLVRSYAGAPLVTPSGHILGTLCIIDTKPLNIGPDEVDALVSLARRVAGELELKSWSRRASARGESGPTLALLEAVCSSVESGILVLDPGRKVLLANKALEEIFGIPVSQILEMTREEFVLRNSTRCDDRVEFLRMMRVLPDGPFSAREVFEMVKPARRRVRWVAKPIQLPGGVGQLEIFDDVTPELEQANSRASLERGTTPAP
jgi:PAS domain-containing protein